MPRNEVRIGFTQWRSEDIRAEEPSRMLQVEDLVVDLDAHRVRRSGKTIKLGPLEYNLLCFLLSNPAEVFTREQLLASVWKTDASIGLRTVDAHISRLRRELTRYGHADPIRTIWKIGYVLG